jgi:hypothetical protein
MHRNFLKTGFGRQRLISAIPGSVPWILVTILGAVVMVTVPLSKFPRSAGLESGPLAAQVETRIATVGYDKKHRYLPFTVYVLTHQLSWKLESADELEDGQTLLSPELILAISDARDVFCVGTASSEGVTRVEEARSAQRAAKLAQWLATAVGNPRLTRLFTLNAGQYQGPKELASAYQRKAIILITGPNDDDVDLSESLTSGLEQLQQKSPVVYSLLHYYSRSGEWLNLSNAAR